MSIDFASLRHLMVEQQIRPWEVLDPRVLETVSSVPREDFVLPRHRALAFVDMALPLDHGQQMMTPAMEGRVLQALQLEGNESVLEVGTGSGYLSACLGRLARQVISVELFPDLLNRAADRLSRCAVRNVELQQGDAMAGYAPSQQFDVVVVTGALTQIPDHIRAWVRTGGRLFAIHGDSPAMEAALLLHSGTARWQTESLFETDLPYLLGAEPLPQFLL